MNRYRAIFVTLVVVLGAIMFPAYSALPSFDSLPTADDTVARRRAFDYYYLQSLALKEQGSHDAALEMLEHCLSIDPDAPAVLFELSNYYMYLGKKTEALALMQRAVKEEPGNFWYRHILATAYENSGLRSDAIAVYESMSKDFPANSEINLMLAGFYTEEGQYDKAIVALDDYERKEGKSEQISLQKYNICILMLDSARAIEEVAKIAADYPDDLRFKVLLGDTYEHYNNSARAYEIYKEVLAQEPDNLSAQLSLVDYYKHNGDKEQFMASIDTLLMNKKMSSSMRSEILVNVITEIEKSGGDSLYITNLCERLMTQPVEQLPILSVYAQYLTHKKADENVVSPLLYKMLSIEPENKMAQLQLLSYAIGRKDYSEIIARSDTAIQYNPEILQLYYYRGVACYQLKKKQEALSTFRRGLECRSEDSDPAFVSELFTIIGDTEHELGNQTATIEAYDSALVYNPRNIVVLNNYAYYLALDGGDLEKAEEMSLRTIKEEPDNPIYIDTYMWILFMQQRYEEAKAYAEKLMQTNDEMSAVEYSHCGDVFAMCGDIERAVELWLEAQKLGDESKILKRKIKKKRYIADDKRGKK
ncbi:MAG: tetratricopeptide repeat protein [Bacteroidaceae bacterium]|nr:tetratricopeptide repeat protein [Bacteroidaceae bacterium]